MLSWERAREIRRRLRERISLEQAEAHYAGLERATIQLMGTTGGRLDYFRARVVAGMGPGDEPWLYDAGATAWAHLHGERGLALVRGGRVVGLIKERMD